MKSFCATVVLLFSATFRLCDGFSAHPSAAAASSATTTTAKTTPILKPSSDGDDDVVSFDTGCVANPVILPPIPGASEWQCYYYGNAGSWNKGHRCFLPTGSSGLAVSTDGISWTKVAGKEEGGAILVPSNDHGAWDCVQTGVGDVIRINDNELHMYYFGGSDEPIAMGPGEIVGFRMRIGRAKSMDNGRTWVKDDGYLLDYDESEGIFASWPRIITSETGPWKMIYHSFDGKKWRVFGAESSDDGDTWKKTGLLLEGGESEDDFDCAGIGTRTVTRCKDGMLLMIYEGVDKKSSTHRLGAAYYDEKSNKWTKLNDGSPILEPGKGPLGEWTKQVIGTPYVVSLSDGSLRLYHCAKDGPEGRMAIGVVESKTGEILPECWASFQ